MLQLSHEFTQIVREFTHILREFTQIMHLGCHIGINNTGDFVSKTVRKEKKSLCLASIILEKTNVETAAH